MEGREMQLRLVDTEPQPQKDFDKFWAKYPRRVAKGAARRAFMQALRKTTPEAIINGAAAYAQWCGNDLRPNAKRFVAHPATWLNDERWEDEYEADDVAAVLDGLFQ